MKRRDIPPYPGQVMYGSIFAQKDPQVILSTLSAGLVATVRNSERLLGDASFLAEAGRFATATFVLTTSKEEMAKSYILLDMCRLDFARHSSILKRLCQAFYDHVSKYAYFAITDMSHFVSMESVKEMWDIKVRRWWPSRGPESDEPDLPHDTYFDREMPLYVQYDPYSDLWQTPDASTRRDAFEEFMGSSEYSDSLKALKRLVFTRDSGLFQANALAVLNDVFGQHYLSETAETGRIDTLYTRLANRLESELGIPTQTMHKSSVHEWPLYHFLTRGVETPL